MAPSTTHRRLALVALQLFDAGVFLTVMVFLLRFEAQSSNRESLHPSWALFAWIVGSVIIWQLALSSAKVYQSHRLSGRFPALEIVSGVSIGAAGIGALALLLQPDAVRLNVIVQAWWITAILALISRVILWALLIGLRAQGRNLRFALIVGSGSRAARLIRRLYEPSTGYRMIGYVDNTEQAHAKRLPGVPYLGRTNSLPRILAENVVDEVFVVLPVRSHYDTIAETIRCCEEQGVPVRIPYDLFVPGISVQSVDMVEGLPVLSLDPSAVSGWYLFMKRSIDIVVSAALLLILSPLLLFVAIRIKLDSPGPVLFVQKRVGMNKRVIPVLKFRTMRVNSEAMQPALECLNEAGGPVFKIRDDPRITGYGRVLRQTSIDELPQLLNVLVGHMSLVGPRPLPLRDVEGFRRDWQRRRFSVRPGITCLWQISGRSAISFDQWMELDMQYIDTRDLLLDFKILLRTIPVVLRGTGAY